MGSQYNNGGRKRLVPIRNGASKRCPQGKRNCD